MKKRVHIDTAYVLLPAFAIVVAAMALQYDARWCAAAFAAIAAVSFARGTRTVRVYWVREKGDK